jgi:hypothetical protein
MSSFISTAFISFASKNPKIAICYILNADCCLLFARFFSTAEPGEHVSLGHNTKIQKSLSATSSTPIVVCCLQDSSQPLSQGNTSV